MDDWVLAEVSSSTSSWDYLQSDDDGIEDFINSSHHQNGLEQDTDCSSGPKNNGVVENQHQEVVVTNCCTDDCPVCGIVAWEIRQEDFQKKKDFLTSGTIWDLELEMKERRQIKFQDPYRLFGRTGRRRCCCSYCNELAQKMEVTRIEPQYLRFSPHYFFDDKQTKQGIVQLNRRIFPVTQFDLSSSFSSLNKSNRWEQDKIENEIKNSLVGVERDRSNRFVEVYDVKVVGAIILCPQEVYLFELEEKRKELENSFSYFGGDSSSSSTSRGNVEGWKRFFNGTYYQFRFSSSSLKTGFNTKTFHEIYQYVRPLKHLSPRFNNKMNELLFIEESKEEFLPFHSTFYSRLSQQEGILRFPLISQESISDELQSHHASYSISRGGARQTFSYNHGICWASYSTPSHDYQDWYMEVDLGKNRRVQNVGGCFVTGIILQGRSPKFEIFPSGCDFETENDYAKYTGPKYPIMIDSKQWIERFELMVREMEGNWISIGIFKGNTDSTTPIRVNLPMISNMKIRFLRIRPLSKEQNGFHGNTPAFKLAIIGKKQNKNSSSCSSTTMIRLQNPKVNLPPKDIPKGHIRYKVVLMTTDDKELKPSNKKIQGPNYSYFLNSSYRRSRMYDGGRFKYFNSRKEKNNFYLSFINDDYSEEEC